MKSWVEQYKQASEENRVRVKREELKLDVAIELWDALERTGMNKADFAEKMGKSKGYVTMLLQGKYNLTLGTLAEVAHYLDSNVKISIAPQKDKSHSRVVKLPMSGKYGKGAEERKWEQSKWEEKKSGENKPEDGEVILVEENKIAVG